MASTPRGTNQDQVTVQDRQATGPQPDQTPVGPGGTPSGPPVGGISSLSQGAGIALTPNPVTATGLVALAPIGGGVIGPLGTATRVPVVTRDIYGRISALTDIAINFPASPAVVINVQDPAYGAVGDGVTDDSTALALAIEATRVPGGIDRAVMTAYGTGYTSAPAVSFVGGFGSGESATALVSIAGASGKVGTIVINARGTGHKVLGKACGIVSGNATVSCTDTSGIVNGVSFQHAAVPYGTTILSFVANTSITLSAAPTASAGAAQCSIGIPFVVLTGGGGTGAAADCVVGNGVELYFPPGAYKCGGLNFTGIHNLTVEAYGASLYVSGASDTGVIIDEFSLLVEFKGLRSENLSATKFGNGTARDPGCGWRIAGSLITLQDCSAYNTPDFGCLFGRDRNTGTASYGNRVFNWLAVGTCGDGFHVSNGCGGCDVNGITIIGPGDDAIAVVADYGVGNEPQNVTINGYSVIGGGHTGIALFGCINVQIGAGLISRCGNYGIEIGSFSGSPPQRITLTGFHIYDIGAGGSERPIDVHRHGLVVVDLVGGRIGPGYIDTTLDLGYFIASTTDVDISEVQTLNCPGGNFSIGSGNTRLTQLYRVAGALTFRGGAGTITTVAPA